MALDENIRRLLAETEITLHPDSFMIVSIDRSEDDKARGIIADLDPFSSLTFDVAEVSLVVKAEDWAVLRKRFEEYREDGPYRLITFDIVLDLSIVGFMAVVSRRLANEGVSIYALSTFLRDHILVKEGDCAKTVEALRSLIAETRQ
ncbi:ACT domain-containing protein [Candidatus Bathyarchaeota archaeon]|nr:ACT domain-containing protein [Candidatus Bathyarchaeota archaeon]MBL7078901.1 ACT domain-containing protein [Candidatus Bathyarchaeota archaeon]